MYIPGASGGYSSKFIKSTRGRKPKKIEEESDYDEEFEDDASEMNLAEDDEIID